MTSRRNRPAPSEPAPDQAVVNQSVADVRKRLSGAGRPNIAAELKRTLGDGIDCYGIKPADVHHIGLDLVRKLRTGGLALSIEIGDPLFRSGNLEEGLIGAQIVGALGRHIGGGDFDRFDAWVNALTNVQTTDALSLNCISRALAAKTSLAMRLVDWAKAPSPWRRRAAVSSFVPLVREGRFTTDALSVAEVVMNDQDEEVQRGVGNMLLEASRLQMDRIVEFLTAWKDRSPQQVIRVASAKLPPDTRSALLGS